jgi:hypothetical protein
MPDVRNRFLSLLLPVFALLCPFGPAGEFDAAAPEAAPEEAAPEMAADGDSEAVYAVQVGPGAAYVADLAAEE